MSLYQEGAENQWMQVKPWVAASQATASVVVSTWVVAEEHSLLLAAASLAVATSLVITASLVIVASSVVTAWAAVGSTQAIAAKDMAIEGIAAEVIHHRLATSFMSLRQQHLHDCDCQCCAYWRSLPFFFYA